MFLRRQSLTRIFEFVLLLLLLLIQCRANAQGLINMKIVFEWFDKHIIFNNTIVYLKKKNDANTII